MNVLSDNVFLLRLFVDLPLHHCHILNIIKFFFLKFFVKFKNSHQNQIPNKLFFILYNIVFNVLMPYVSLTSCPWISFLLFFFPFNSLSGIESGYLCSVELVFSNQQLHLLVRNIRIVISYPDLEPITIVNDWNFWIHQFSNIYDTAFFQVSNQKYAY